MPLKQRVSEWDGRKWYTVTAVYYADPLDIVPDGKGGYWFGAQAILSGSTWTTEEVPGFTGGYGGVPRMPGTTFFLLNAGWRLAAPQPKSRRSSGSISSRLAPRLCLGTDVARHPGEHPDLPILDELREHRSCIDCRAYRRLERFDRSSKLPSPQDALSRDSNGPAPGWTVDSPDVVGDATRTNEFRMVVMSYQA
jgi:hypothetical protein